MMVQKVNPYVKILESQYKGFYFNEQSAPLFKTQWKKGFFKTKIEENKKLKTLFSDSSDKNFSLDLEIGMGKGDHIIARAKAFKERIIIGMDLRYKRLAQALKKAKRLGIENIRVIRSDARKVGSFFSKNEIQDIFIHFPDPWEKRKQKKHRLLNLDFVYHLYSLQKKGGKVEIKTDCKEYFEEILGFFERLSYQTSFKSYNFCNFKESQGVSRYFKWCQKNDLISYETPFEKIFVRKNQPVHFALFLRS